MKNIMINYNHISEKKFIQIHHLDTDSFVLRVHRKENPLELNTLLDMYGFSNLGENHELFNNKNKKVIGKHKMETPKNT